MSEDFHPAGVLDQVAVERELVQTSYILESLQHAALGEQVEIQRHRSKLKIQVDQDDPSMRYAHQRMRDIARQERGAAASLGIHEGQQCAVAARGAGPVVAI